MNEKSFFEKTFILLMIILWAGTFHSCTFQKPTFKYLEITHVDLFRREIKVDLVLDNPNKLSFSVSGVKLWLSMNGDSLVTIIDEEIVPVNFNSEFHVPLHINIRRPSGDWSSFIQKVVKEINDRQSFEFKLDGMVEVKYLWKKAEIPFHKVKSISAKDMVTL